MTGGWLRSAAVSSARCWRCCCCTPMSRFRLTGWSRSCGVSRRRRARSSVCRSRSRGCAVRSTPMIRARLRSRRCGRRPAAICWRWRRARLDAELFRRACRTGVKHWLRTSPRAPPSCWERRWRCGAGPALAEVVYEPFAQAEIRRLEELRLTALEARIEADLRLSRHAALAGELEMPVAQPSHARAAGRAADARPVSQRPPGRRARRLSTHPHPPSR